MTDFDAFMAKMRTMPPMGATSVMQDVDFWREIDQMQQHPTTSNTNSTTGDAQSYGYHHARF